ncbi:hypothetical protein ISS22_17355 [candidate division KSB1 bacterium]|nr:hypothetical protein [candidate division KSB1 bacterium]
MSVELSIDGILEDLRSVEPKIAKYEKKYRLLSPYFYKLYQSGKLNEHHDFVDWAGLYRIRIKRIKLYEQKLSESYRSSRN